MPPYENKVTTKKGHARVKGRVRAVMMRVFVWRVEWNKLCFLNSLPGLYIGRRKESVVVKSQNRSLVSFVYCSGLMGSVGIVVQFVVGIQVNRSLLN